MEDKWGVKDCGCHRLACMIQNDTLSAVGDDVCVTKQKHNQRVFPVELEKTNFSVTILVERFAKYKDG